MRLLPNTAAVFGLIPVPCAQSACSETRVFWIRKASLARGRTSSGFSERLATKEELAALRFQLRQIEDRIAV
jgi:hypothetical protein